MGAEQIVSEIAVGEVVRLKSEKRAMTVTEGFVGLGWWTCVWLDNEGHQQKGCYPAAALVVVGPSRKMGCA